ncbi:MAG: ABC transporter permease [Clostridiales bacterium]|nr:ABC transporter permease [Clostridiales bacterium]
MGILVGVLEQGLIYGIMALGVYITYTILDFPDLTVDGSFPLGAAVTAVLLAKGVNPYLTLLISFFFGIVIGIFTGLIHVKLKVRDLLSGIIMMTALYSVNMRIAGKANVPLFSEETVFDNAFLNALFPASLAPFQTVIIAFIITLIAKLLLDLYLKTKSGYLLRAVGDNETIVTTLAKDKGTVKIIGLAIANGLVALSGSVMCQQQRFFEVSMGTGTVVIGLANVIIGINVFKNVPFMKATTAVLIGAILYKGCVAFAIAQGMNATDLKFITAFLFLIILVITMDRKKKVKKNA